MSNLAAREFQIRHPQPQPLPAYAGPIESPRPTANPVSGKQFDTSAKRSKNRTGSKLRQAGSDQDDQVCNLIKQNPETG